VDFWENIVNTGTEGKMRERTEENHIDQSKEKTFKWKRRITWRLSESMSSPLRVTGEQNEKQLLKSTKTMAKTVIISCL